MILSHQLLSYRVTTATTAVETPYKTSRTREIGAVQPGRNDIYVDGEEGDVYNGPTPPHGVLENLEFGIILEDCKFAELWSCHMANEFSGSLKLGL